ncbi:hypothetical protein [Dongia deserti]|uniref:hypothetical protein n=1 Tax=Dongia deserti TaxID=2268030 RepID=UPI000E647CB5|nr:hypothetical protein [Dongia deserti]
MNPGILKSNAKAKARTNRTKGTIARWISFLALVALFAMATLPITSGQRDVAFKKITHWSETWHG